MIIANPKRAGKRERLVSGIIIVALTLFISITYHDQLLFNEELYSLSVVSLLLASSALIAEPLAVTPAVIEIVLGVLAGSSGIPRAASVELLGLIGSVFIMYMAGLEIDPSLLRRLLVPSMIAGVISFLAPAVAAYFALTIIGYSRIEAMLAAIGTATTSVAVVYAIIRRKAMSRRPLGQTILATAMIADVASILAFVLVEAGITLIVVIYFIGLAVAVWILSRFLEWVSGGEHEVELRLILSFLIAAALVSEYVGVHAILFAFLLGITTRGTITKNRLLEDKLGALTFGLLAPIFFIDAGLHATPEHPLLYAELAGLLLLVTFPTKIMATHFSLRLLTKRRIRLRISTVFGARLTVSTVIAFTGEATGVLSHDLAGAVIMSALIATIVSAILAGAPIPEEA
ncbi:MAG: cation:proton antiporter [Desulfurococcales archaeon]|nr:cation:proton antiporter [Desulfurococcales archaeon]